MSSRESEHDPIELGEKLWEALLECEEADGFNAPHWDRARAVLREWDQMMADRFAQTLHYSDGADA